MAIINKTGITNGGTVQAEHITRAIDALSGVSADSIVATGSLFGSASYAESSSYALTASYAMNGGGGASDTASFALTASSIQVTNDSSVVGPMPILLSQGTAGNSRAVIADQSDFAFNPIANLLTVANISSTISGTSVVTMTASFANSASNAITSSVAQRISTTSPSAPKNGEMWAVETGVGSTAEMYIFLNGTTYVINMPSL